MDRKQVETSWAQRGFSCGLWTDPPGQSWENFVHKSDEIVMVVDGNVEFEIGGKIYHPQSGDELFIPSGVLHSVRNIGSSTAHWLYGYRQNSESK
jgi:quercetin dioxygenase-like cupin family protein